MKKFTDVNGKMVRLSVDDVGCKKASSYAKGCEGIEQRFEFDFEREAWLKGEADDHRIREEIKRGER